VARVLGFSFEREHPPPRPALGWAIFFFCKTRPVLNCFLFARLRGALFSLFVKIMRGAISVWPPLFIGVVSFELFASLFAGDFPSSPGREKAW